LFYVPGKKTQVDMGFRQFINRFHDCRYSSACRGPNLNLGRGVGAGAAMTRR
jgi:hypothetical protein